MSGRYVDARTQELECINFLDLIGDKEPGVSSLRIIKGAAAEGRWQSITTTESMEYSFHVGINYGSSRGSTYEI